jgi:hypothetical protein
MFSLCLNGRCRCKIAAGGSLQGWRPRASDPHQKVSCSNRYFAPQQNNYTILQHRSDFSCAVQYPLYLSFLPKTVVVGKYKLASMVAVYRVANHTRLAGNLGFLGTCAEQRDRGGTKRLVNNQKPRNTSENRASSQLRCALSMSLIWTTLQSSAPHSVLPLHRKRPTRSPGSLATPISQLPSIPKDIRRKV